MKRTKPHDPAAMDAPPTDATAVSGLVAHIQGVMEHQKALLARELHDELGGLLVGAVMDVAWAEQHLSSPTAELKQKLLRARQTLAAAIDMKRKLIEELRPTLLDNVGLFAALRWHIQAVCERANITCEVHVPEEERRFPPNVPIVLFRIVQEALAVIVARKPLGAAQFRVTVDGRELSITLQSGTTAAPNADTEDAPDVHYLAAIEQRAASSGGTFMHSNVPGVGTRIAVSFPLAKILAPA